MLYDSNCDTPQYDLEIAGSWPLGQVVFIAHVLRIRDDPTPEIIDLRNLTDGTSFDYHFLLGFLVILVIGASLRTRANFSSFHEPAFLVYCSLWLPLREPILSFGGAFAHDDVAHGLPIAFNASLHNVFTGLRHCVPLGDELQRTF